VGDRSGSNPRRANGHRRDMVVRWLRSQGRPCWICREFGRSGVIDYTLPPGHPFSFECDELVPVSKGGSPFSRSNVDAAHRCCNQWRGNRSVDEVRRIAHGAGRKDERLNASPPAPSVRGVTSRLSD